MVKIQEKRVEARDDYNLFLLSKSLYTFIGFTTLVLHALNKFCIVDPDMRFDGFEITGLGLFGTFVTWGVISTLGRVAKWH